MDKEKIKQSLQLRDRSVRVLSKDGKFRVACVKNTHTAQTAQRNHNLDGISGTILAKTLAAASLSASFLKGEERIIVELDGNGKLSKVFAEAMQLGEVRGFVYFKDDDRNIEFKDMSELLGVGLLRVSRVLYNRMEPIQGIVPIQKGDISSDLAYYYNHSEQVPTSVILDCSIDDEGNILQSGGLILQAMPGYSDEDLLRVFESLQKTEPLYTYFEQGLNPKQVLSKILPFEFDLINSTQVDFFCRCSKDNFVSKLLTLGLEEIKEMEAENHNELICRYCNKHYYLDSQDFKAIKEQLIAKNN